MQNNNKQFTEKDFENIKKEYPFEEFAPYILEMEYTTIIPFKKEPFAILVNLNDKKTCKIPFPEETRKQYEK